MDNTITEKYQLNSILDIYGGKENGQTINTANKYYINHNIVNNGIVLADKIIPVNNMHKISNAYIYDQNNSYDNISNYNNEFNKFYPLLINKENYYSTKNNYKLISAKDIDFENAYLKYATIQTHFNEPLSYYDLSINSNGEIVAEQKFSYSYFDREISPYINNSYDLLNIIDYLFNRINNLNNLLKIVKEQKNIVNTQ